MLLYIDINDACNLKCATCPRGVRAFPNTSKKMSTDLFRRIVEKGVHDGAYQVGLFNWIEPFLISNLQEYTAIVKQFGLRCEVSSTLSLRRIDCLLTCLKTIDLLWVTISGYSQSIYQINHVSGNVEYVFRHLRDISNAKKSGKIETDVILRFLKFDYNADDEIILRSLAQEYEFHFETLLGTGHPIRMKAPPTREQEIAQLLGSFSSARKYDEPGTVCPLIFEHIAVNADGDVYQCSAHGYHPQLRIGAYLDLSREEILMRRYTHPFCNFCDWKRRQPTDVERTLLDQALDARLGRPVLNRVPRLSGPDTPAQYNQEGDQLPKDGHDHRW